MRLVTIMLLLSMTTAHAQTVYFNYSQWKQMPTSLISERCMSLGLLMQFRSLPYLSKQLLPGTITSALPRLD